MTNAQETAVSVDKLFSGLEFMPKLFPSFVCYEKVLKVCCFSPWAEKESLQF